MRTKVLLASLALFLILLAAFVFRPWSPWSPWKMLKLFSPEVRASNFQHMDGIFPSRPLHRSTQPYVFAMYPQSLPSSYVFNGKQLPLEAFMEKTSTTGLMVLHKGAILHEEYRRGASATSTLTSWSVAKSVVATLVGIAHKEGKIASLDDKASKYIPELAGKAYGEASIKDLLRMASGVKFDENYASLTSDIRRLFYKVFLLGRPIDEAVMNLPAEDPPGTKFHYKSVDSQVLAWVLRNATGQSVTQYAQEKLWQPLGMQDEGFWNLDHPDGNELAYCCLNITLRDYAKLGQLYLQKGEWQGRQLLPADWVQESTKRPEPWLTAGHGYPERGYGYHWWVPKDPDQEFFANGIWGQHIFVDEKSGIVIVKTSADPDFQKNTAEMIAFMRGIVKGYAQAR
ncbi:MAG: serine hydrolase [Pedobacter sp.]|nr:serine hydrolase [Pedobacter sp.]